MSRTKKVLRRLVPSHATLVAYLALFMAMGGTAYASVQWSSADIADGSLQSVDVRDNSLTGADIAAGSISSTDLAAGTIPTGGSGSSLLASAYNPGTVTTAAWVTDRTTTPTATSATFTVPAGEKYLVLVYGEATGTQVAGRCDDWFGYGGGQSGYLGIFADGDYANSLIVYTLTTGLPGGAHRGTQIMTFGPGEHTLIAAPNPDRCSNIGDPGSVTLTGARLAVTLLAEL